MPLHKQKEFLGAQEQVNLLKVSRDAVLRNARSRRREKGFDGAVEIRPLVLLGHQGLDVRITLDGRVDQVVGGAQALGQLNGNGRLIEFVENVVQRPEGIGKSVLFPRASRDLIDRLFRFGQLMLALRFGFRRGFRKRDEIAVSRKLRENSSGTQKDKEPSPALVHLSPREQ